MTRLHKDSPPRWQKRTWAIVLGCCTLLGANDSAIAQNLQKLGVIRSPENAAQWTSINNRLQGIGIDYCILDLSDLDTEANLDQIGVIFLPNVETLDGVQVSRLQQWFAQGGAIVASGPTGSLSSPAVRSQLRSLLGAYWGFPLTNPASLEPLRPRLGNWTWKDPASLTQTARGGVIIPSDLNSATVAVWQAEGTPPAVVITERTTFLGWRWGFDTVTNSQFDTAWLQAALSRHNNLSQSSNPQPENCLNTTIAAPPPQPEPTPEVPQRPAPLPEPTPLEMAAASPVASKPTLTPEDLILDANADRAFTPPSLESLAIAPSQIRSLNQDLDRLLGRVQSAVLLAEASEQENIRLSTAIERYLETQDRGQNSNPSTSLNLPGLGEARSRLQTFVNYIEQQDYPKARRQAETTRLQLLDSYPVSRRILQPEIRAVWLDRGTIVKAQSAADLAVIFDRLAAAGINTVFFETVNASYPIYPSQVAPEQNPLTQGWDPLQAAVQLAHARNMELHAWVWIFAAANQRHNEILNQPANYLGPVLSQNPDWRATDKAGNVFHRNSRKAFFDPANPEVRQYLLSLLTEIATEYDVDGIHFDYIRYPFQDPRVNQTYGYGEAARSQFRNQTGTDPISIYPGSPLWSTWTEFRIDQVNQFVATASRQLKANRSDLLISAAVFPIPETERLARLQQHWEAWIEAGHLDLLVPMTYALDSESFQQLTEPLFVANRLNHNTLAIPGIRLLRLPTPLAVDQIQVLRDLPAAGYALFATENLGLNLQTILQQTQGSRRIYRNAPLPHRQPFSAARDRFYTLRQEWIVMLNGQQINLDTELLQEWGAQTDTLAIALEQLAADPNPSNLRIAQRNLTRFQDRFDRWLGASETLSAYQTQTWRNRLDAIAQLLRYGKTKIENRR
ncbi:MAG: glycoside hydrolase family 10 protein [Spirulinaceae cyanobacterium]